MQLQIHLRGEAFHGHHVRAEKVAVAPRRGNSRSQQPRTARAAPFFVASALLTTVLLGCYAPMRSGGVPAETLPDYFRSPMRSLGPALNFANLTFPPPELYRLGRRDVLLITIPGLYDKSETEPLRVTLIGDGLVTLPEVGQVNLADMTLTEAADTIRHALEERSILQAAHVSLELFQPSNTEVVVLGAVASPGVFPLAKYQSDVAHALAAAGGMTEDASRMIEIHRRSEFLPRRPNSCPNPPSEVLQVPLPEVVDPTAYLDPRQPDLVQPEEKQSSGEVVPEQMFPFVSSASTAAPLGCYLPETVMCPGDSITRIPLQGPEVCMLNVNDVVLRPGDVVVVPPKKKEVFWVVGQLDENNALRFNVGLEAREIGGGFLLPPDRDIDVVTAVAMAGYIDPIDSPTTATVHRTQPDGRPFLIHVDLIAARYNRQATVYVQPNDIIYLNPDACWWWRRTFDRVVPDLITIPYRRIFFSSSSRN